MKKLISISASTISALSNEIEKCGGVESLSAFGSDGASVMIGHKEVASKFKRNFSKISIHYHNRRLALAILPFFF